MSDTTVPLFDAHCHCGLVFDEQGPALPGSHELIASVETRHWGVLPHLLDEARSRFGALGLHPWYAGQWGCSCTERLEVLLANPEVVAVGEVGLDPRAKVDMEVQEQVLRAQIRIAIKADKPLILHVSKGYNDIMHILRDEGAQRVGGVVHGFSAGANIGNAFIRLGFYLGIGPLLLRQNVRKLPEALRHLPVECLVLETDTQGGMEGYAHPEQRTSTLASITRKLAELYATTEEQMRSRLWRNSCELLHLNSAPGKDVC